MSKILHICTGFSIDFQGGITNYVRSIANEQNKNGHDVFIMADSGVDNGYKIIRFRSKIRNTLFYNKRDNNCNEFLSNFFRENKFDVIHIHMILNMDYRLADILIKNKLKYIVSLHDYYYICPRVQMVPFDEDRCEQANSKKCASCFSVFFKTLYLRKAFEKVFGLKFVEKFPFKSKIIYQEWFNTYEKLLAHAKALLPVSNRVMEIYKNSGINGNYKVLHIGNLAALDFDYVKKTNESKEINVVFLSLASKIKGADLFCDLIKKTKNQLLRFHFYGRCDAKMKNKLENSGVICHGNYLQSELKNILEKMDLGVVIPIWEDNGPQVVMEMLNNKLPVLGTKMGGIPDFVNDKNGFLFNPYDKNEVEKAVNFLDNLNRDEIKIKISNIKRTLTPHEHYLELEKIYADIIEGNY